MYCFYFARALSQTQKDLLLAYAETDTKVEGTVNGITDTKDGKFLVQKF